MLYALLLSFVSISQNQTFWSITIPVEYKNKQVNINAIQKDIYFFEGKVLVKKIEAGHSERVLIKGEDSKLFSQKSFKLSDVLILKESNFSNNFISRNTPLLKEIQNKKIIAWSILSILALIVFVRVSNNDVFFGFLMPWIAYSNTQELVAKMNTRKILLPILIFCVVMIGVVWIFYGYNSEIQMVRSIFIALLIFLIKIILLVVLEFLFAIRGFSKMFLIEFLKLSILFFLLLFAVRLIDILNPFNLHFVYKILLLLYFIIWLSRIVLIFYRAREQKIIHFFSYLCVSEAIPIILLFAFWDS